MSLLQGTCLGLECVSQNFLSDSFVSPIGIRQFTFKVTTDIDQLESAILYLFLVVQATCLFPYSSFSDIFWITQEMLVLCFVSLFTYTLYIICSGSWITIQIFNLLQNVLN